MRQCLENPKMMAKLLERVHVSPPLVEPNMELTKSDDRGLGGAPRPNANARILADEHDSHRYGRRPPYHPARELLRGSDPTIKADSMQALESMGKWKVQVRNKVEDSKIEEPVRAIVAAADDHLRDLALGVS